MKHFIVFSEDMAFSCCQSNFFHVCYSHRIHEMVLSVMLPGIFNSTNPCSKAHSNKGLVWHSATLLSIMFSL